jgi:RNA polymerase sigma-70 factor (ECF subfamily)
VPPISSRTRFLGTYRDFAAFHGCSRDELCAWLRKILEHNLAVFRRRYRATQKRQVALEVPIGVDGEEDAASHLPVDSVSPSANAARQEQAEALLAALARIPDDYRRVVLWHHHDRLTFREIGRRLRRSPEAARKLWSRALVRLAEELGPAHDPRA